jgi:hypothetical protein
MERFFFRHRLLLDARDLPSLGLLACIIELDRRGKMVSRRLCTKATVYLSVCTACVEEEAASKKKEDAHDYFAGIHRDHTPPAQPEYTPSISPPSDAALPSGTPTTSAIGSSGGSWSNLAAFFNGSVFQRTPPTPSAFSGKRQRTISVRSSETTPPISAAPKSRPESNLNRRASSEVFGQQQQNPSRRLSRNTLFGRGGSGSTPAVTFGQTQVITPRTPSLVPPSSYRSRQPRAKAVNVVISRTKLQE